MTFLKRSPSSRDHMRLEARGALQVLKYTPYLLAFKDEGFYSIAGFCFVRQYSAYTRPRMRPCPAD